MTEPTPTVVDCLVRAWPPQRWRDTTVIAAVSGGADSVAMLRAMTQGRVVGLGSIVVAHFNHRWRGPLSDADAAFVRELAASLGLECVSASAMDEGPKSEEAARAERLAFLLAVARRTGARSIATAHTADDQVETILHRIVRGTGLAGLAGIPRAREAADGVSLVRPLLDCRRDELRAYLANLGQSFREDSTNLDRRFTRARVRHELLPWLVREMNAEVADAVLRLGLQAAEAHEFLQAAAEKLLESAVVEESADAVELDPSTMTGSPACLVREAFAVLWRRRGWPLAEMSFDKWRLLAEVAMDEAVVRHATLPGTVLVVRGDARFTLRRPHA